MDLFKFPFDADVWGTASEWVMIMVTIGTAFLLWQTLKSQRDVQATQNRLLEIEHLRLREDYRPELAFSRYEDGKISSNVRDRVISIAIINAGQKPVKNVRVEYPKSDFIEGNAMTIDSYKNILRTTEKVSLHLIFTSFDENVLKDTFQFPVHYEDMVGFKYEQMVICHFEFQNKDNLKLDPFDPRLIE